MGGGRAECELNTSKAYGQGLFFFPDGKICIDYYVLISLYPPDIMGKNKFGNSFGIINLDQKNLSENFN
jgi:hypothetical protein